MFNPFHRHDDAVPPAFLASGMVAWEENYEQDESQEQELTPDDCCWCHPNTIANSVCASHIEAIANTPRRRH